MGGPGRGKPTFPPLVTHWTVKSEPNWPGAEYTRRTRLKTVCDGSYTPTFMAELRATLGEENFAHFEAAMKPRVKDRARGHPPPAVKPAAQCKIPASYKLRRAEAETNDLGATTDSMGQHALGELGSTTLSVMGTVSKSRVLDITHTKWGPTPSYLFEDREQVCCHCRACVEVPVLPPSPWCTRSLGGSVLTAVGVGIRR